MTTRELGYTTRERDLELYFAQPKYSNVFNMVYVYIVYEHFGEGKFNAKDYNPVLIDIIKNDVNAQFDADKENNAEIYFQKIYRKIDNDITRIRPKSIIPHCVEFDFTEKIIDVILYYLKHNDGEDVLQKDYSLFEIIHVAFVLARSFYEI